LLMLCSVQQFLPEARKFVETMKSCSGNQDHLRICNRYLDTMAAHIASLVAQQDATEFEIALSAGERQGKPYELELVVRKQGPDLKVEYSCVFCGRLLTGAVNESLAKLRSHFNSGQCKKRPCCDQTLEEERDNALRYLDEVRQHNLARKKHERRPSLPAPPALSLKRRYPFEVSSLDKDEKRSRFKPQALAAIDVPAVSDLKLWPNSSPLPAPIADGRPFLGFYS